jgi:WD40 repeat protein
MGKKGKIQTKEIKVVDAPDLLDDFYISQIDWSSANIIATGLHSTLFLMNYSSGKIIEANSTHSRRNGGYSRDDPVITAVKFNLVEPTVCALGFDDGKLELWDMERVS